MPTLAQQLSDAALEHAQHLDQYESAMTRLLYIALENLSMEGLDVFIAEAQTEFEHDQDILRVLEDAR